MHTDDKVVPWGIYTVTVNIYSPNDWAPKCMKPNPEEYMGERNYLTIIVGILRYSV